MPLPPRSLSPTNRLWWGIFLSVSSCSLLLIPRVAPPKGFLRGGVTYVTLRTREKPYFCPRKAVHNAVWLCCWAFTQPPKRKWAEPQKKKLLTTKGCFHQAQTINQSLNYINQTLNYINQGLVYRLLLSFSTFLAEATNFFVRSDEQCQNEGGILYIAVARKRL